MLDTNAIKKMIQDMQERADALRGYL